MWIGSIAEVAQMQQALKFEHRLNYKYIENDCEPVLHDGIGQGVVKVRVFPRSIALVTRSKTVIRRYDYKDIYRIDMIMSKHPTQHLLYLSIHVFGQPVGITLTLKSPLKLSKAYLDETVWRFRRTMTLNEFMSLRASDQKSLLAPIGRPMYELAKSAQRVATFNEFTMCTMDDACLQQNFEEMVAKYLV